MSKVPLQYIWCLVTTSRKHMVHLDLLWPSTSLIAFRKGRYTTVVPGYINGVSPIRPPFERMFLFVIRLILILLQSCQISSVKYGTFCGRATVLLTRVVEEAARSL